MSNAILQAFAKLKKTDFYQINVSWINTSISTGFRVIEIPFIINFLTRSSNATENISAKFHIKPKHAYKILLLPCIISIALFYLLNINPWGIEKYFAMFQGVEDFAPFVQTRILLITIIAAFLFKQYLKGVLIYQKKITSIKVLSYLNVLGLSVSGLLLWFFPQSLLITGSLMYLASVLFETVFSVSAIYRR